jgi:hypothetical protein
MKHKTIVISTIVMLILLLAVTTAFAMPATTVSDKPTDKTPGAKATEKAIEKATEGKGQGKQKFNYKGVIDAVSDSSLTISTNDGASVTFQIDEETSIKVATLGKDATTSNLLVSMQVTVRAQKVDETNLLALSITAIPGKPEKIHHVGKVTDYQAGASITILASDGNSYTFELTADTKILPEERADQLAVDMRVTIISSRDVAGGKLIASGIVVHPEGSAAGQEKTPGEGSDESETLEPSESPAP